MEIREMSPDECLKVLAGARLARLACAYENQPYIVPVYLTYHEASGFLYGFTTPGQKVTWMRANPLVCVEVDEVAGYDQWVSVIVIGHYEELPEAAESGGAPGRAPDRSDSRQRGGNDPREQAWLALKAHPEWDKPGTAAWAARAHGDTAAPIVAVYYRIRINCITGHKATRDAREANSAAAPAPPNGK